MAQQLQFQDMIIPDYKQEHFKIISAEKWHDFVTNVNYSPILSVLSSKPLTISEIHELYPPDKVKKKKKVIQREPKPYQASIQSASVQMTPLVQEVEQVKKKSENTIYRYVKDLIDAGLVVEVGRRIFPNQSFTKILYARTAKIFSPENFLIEFWDTDQSHIVAKTVGLMLNHHFENKNPSAPDLAEFFKSFEKFTTNSRDKLLQEIAKSTELVSSGDNKRESSQEIINSINNLDCKESSYFYTNLGEIIWLFSHPDLVEVYEDLKGYFSLDSERSIDSSDSHEDLSESEFQDFIQFEPVLIRLIDDTSWNNYFKGFNHSAITEMLRKGPMTIKELHDGHHAMVIEKIKRENEKCEECKKKRKSLPKEKPKKENTVYRYVKDLIKGGFVTEAGRRVFPNQSSTQILYSRTAKIFYYLGNWNEFWMSEKGKNVTYTLGLALSYHLKKTEFDSEKLGLVLLDYVRTKEKSLEQALINATDDSVIDPIKTFDKKETKGFLYMLELIEWINTQKDQETFSSRLLECFN
ncbi:MAG: hypothetical protein ACXAC7_05875 [Candidatus Hodarchaeales archaeon]|jgi:predicted transcriptional regulator